MFPVSAARLREHCSAHRAHIDGKLAALNMLCREGESPGLMLI
jgi:hypothetical protein